MLWAAIIGILVPIVCMGIPMILDYKAEKKERKENDDRNDTNN